MPREFTVSRRTAIAALGTVGVASAGAGVGTSAFFSDGESFENDRLVAGTLDMTAAYSVQVADATAAENGYTKPERDDPDESGLETLPGEPPTDHHVELLDTVRTAYWIDDGDDYVDGDEAFQSRGSLRGVLGDLSGIGVVLEGDVSSERGGGTGG